MPRPTRLGGEGRVVMSARGRDRLRRQMPRGGPCLVMRFVLLLAAVSFAGPVPAVEYGRPIALVGATLIDGTEAEPLREAVLVVDGSRIAAVGSADATPVPPQAQVIEVHGKWIVPGLIDAHVHFFQSGGLYTRPDVIDLRRWRPYTEEIAHIRAVLPRTLARYLASGVTSVVDLAGPAWTLDIRDLAKRLDAAGAASPRLVVAGPGLAPTMPPALRTPNAPGVVVRTPEQATAAIRDLSVDQPDLIKIWFMATPGMDLEREFAWVRAAVAQAHAAGRRVAAHATEREIARHMLDAGVDILVHSVSDEPLDDELLERMRERDVLYVTTLGVGEGYREVLGQKVRLTDIEWRLGDPEVIATLDDLTERFGGANRRRISGDDQVAYANLRRVHAAGVTVAAGSDAGNIGTLHGPALHHELELMVEAGLSPRDVLLAATRGGARVMGREHDLGTLVPGKLADFLILDADPLEDIRNTRRLAWVVKNGIFYSADALERHLMAGHQGY